MAQLSIGKPDLILFDVIKASRYFMTSRLKSYYKKNGCQNS